MYPLLNFLIYWNSILLCIKGGVSTLLSYLYQILYHISYLINYFNLHYANSVIYSFASPYFTLFTGDILVPKNGNFWMSILFS
jgi:hypothetical protein